MDEKSKIEEYLEELPKGENYEFIRKVLTEVPEEESLKEASVTKDGLTATEDGSSDDLDEFITKDKESNSDIDLKEFLNSKGKNIRYTNTPLEKEI